MQYENNNKKCFTEKKKQDLVFKKPFSKRYIWEKDRRLIIRVVLYSGQYGSKHISKCYCFCCTLNQSRRDFFKTLKILLFKTLTGRVYRLASLAKASTTG